MKKYFPDIPARMHRCRRWADSELVRAAASHHSLGFFAQEELQQLRGGREHTSPRSDKGRRWAEQSDEYPHSPSLPSSSIRCKRLDIITLYSSVLECTSVIVMEVRTIYLARRPVNSTFFVFFFIICDFVENYNLLESFFFGLFQLFNIFQKKKLKIHMWGQKKNGSIAFSYRKKLTTNNFRFKKWLKWKWIDL